MERYLYCSSFGLWQGTLAVCCKRMPDWIAEPATQIAGGIPEFLEGLQRQWSLIDPSSDVEAVHR